MKVYRSDWWKKGLLGSGEEGDENIVEFIGGWWMVFVGFLENCKEDMLIEKN